MEDNNIFAEICNIQQLPNLFRKVIEDRYLIMKSDPNYKASKYGEEYISDNIKIEPQINKLLKDESPENIYRKAIYSYIEECTKINDSFNLEHNFIDNIKNLHGEYCEDCNDERIELDKYMKDICESEKLNNLQGKYLQDEYSKMKNDNEYKDAVKVPLDYINKETCVYLYLYLEGDNDIDIHRANIICQIALIRQIDKLFKKHHDFVNSIKKLHGNKCERCNNNI